MLTGTTNKTNNWSGSTVYRIDIELYSFKNELLKYEGDLNYKIICDNYDESLIDCKVGSQEGTAEYSGIISESENNTDKITIYVIPKLNEDGTSKVNFNTKVSLRIRAIAESTYKKSLYADYEITAKGIEYSVDDIEYGNYSTITLKNLTKEATMVSVEVPVNELRMDMSDIIVGNTEQYETEYTTQDIDGEPYVKKITFKMQPESSKSLHYYKVNKYTNYKNLTWKFNVKSK